MKQRKSMLHLKLGEILTLGREGESVQVSEVKKRHFHKEEKNYSTQPCHSMRWQDSTA